MLGDDLIPGHHSAIRHQELAVEPEVVLAVLEVATDHRFAEEDLLFHGVGGRNEPAEEHQGQDDRRNCPAREGSNGERNGCHDQPQGRDEEAAGSVADE